jgi:hypothetical protein
MKLIIKFYAEIQLYKIKHYCLIGSECCEKSTSIAVLMGSTLPILTVTFLYSSK